MNIPLENNTKVEMKTWHNLKMKWPSKILRLYYRDQDNTTFFGVALGGKFTFAKGWQDDAYLWKEKIASIIKEKYEEEFKVFCGSV